MAGFVTVPAADMFDVAVIGAGVVGCAVARRFTLEGARVVVLERAPDLLAGASKANSALLHTGFDAPVGSLECACMQRGYREYHEIKDGLNLPLLETGAMVVAWTDREADALCGIQAQAVANGVDDTVLLDRAGVLRREPEVAPTAVAGLLVPGEHVIDAWSAPLAYMTQAVANGAVVLFDAVVTDGQFDGTAWRLETARGPVATRFVVNCAGLFGDRLDAALLGAADFTIRPRKGQFVVFDKAAAKLLTTIILPVPNETTKGVVLARTAYGNLLVGPTAEEQEGRERATVDQPTLEALVTTAARLVPALAGMPVTATYAGLRPATEAKHYRIGHRPDRRWLTLGGIRSTGLTAALGLATHAVELWRGDGGTLAPLADPIVTPVPNIAEHRPRDWEQRGYGEIICHCEMVTEREIAATLGSPLPPGDFAGLKRRTRAGMGRCQGFYCNARLAAMTKGRFAAPLAIGSLDA